MAKKSKIEDAENTMSAGETPIKNYANDKDSDIYKECAKLYPQIELAFRNRKGADADITEYWNIYNAKTDENQRYDGNSECYPPIVRDSVNARCKRALKQLFSSKYKHVDAIGSSDETPTAQMALIEHYIRTTKLKSICRSTLISGDVTGQWNIYIDWKRTYRQVSGMIKRNPLIETVEGQSVELTDPMEEREETEDYEVMTEGPDIVDFATEDLVVIPPTVNNIEDADISCIKLRMSKDKVEELVEDGTFITDADSEEAGEIATWLVGQENEDDYAPSKKAVHQAGIQTMGTLKFALIYEAHVRLKLEDGKKYLCYVYFAGESEILGIIKAPQWGQKRPIISAPVERATGSFNGISKIEAVKTMQWNLNDFFNMGQDSAQYSLLPIVMTDPEKNPNYAMMIFGLAAVWPCDPNSTKFQQFPQLWKESMGMVGSIKQQIFESMDVNQGMMGAVAAGRKNNAMVGSQMQEQSVSVIDHAERFEDEILNELVERMFEYDAQFREQDLTVLKMGEIGVKAAMTTIPPQQWGDRYDFQWCGTSFVMSMQLMQQQIATMNVLRGIPPQQLNGRKLDITPILEILVNNVFGVEIGSRVLIDERNKYSVLPDVEDEMMENGIMVDVHEADDDMQHLQTHQEAAKATGDPTGLMRTHMQGHMMQVQRKREMAAGMQPPPGGGEPGIPGGAGPGVAGTPRPGAQPAPQRPMQNPAGAIQQDNMIGAPGRG